MKTNYQQLTQSKFFIPEFNSAIFDGPIRIYFDQTQEALALKIYFQIQNHFLTEVKRIKDSSLQSSASLYLMLYPSGDHFENNLGSSEKFWLEDWENDVVLGVNDLSQGLDLNSFDLQFAKSLQL